MDAAAACERTQLRLPVAPPRQRRRPLLRAPQLVDLLAREDDAAVHDPGHGRRQLAGRDGEHGLVQERETVGNAAGVDEDGALGVKGERGQIRITELLADLDGRRRRGRRALEVACGLVLEHDRHQHVALLDALSTGGLHEALGPAEPCGCRPELTVEGVVHADPEREVGGTQAVSGLAAPPVGTLVDPNPLVFERKHVRGGRKQLEVVGRELRLAIGARQQLVRVCPGGLRVGLATAIEDVRRLRRAQSRLNVAGTVRGPQSRSRGSTISKTRVHRLLQAQTPSYIRRMEHSIAATPRRSGPSRFLHPLAEARTYLETFHLWLDLVVGVFWFSVLTTLIACGVSLLITLVGLPILTATFLLARGGAYVERRRVALLLGTHIEQPTRRAHADDRGFRRLVAPFRDRTTWKEVAYLWIAQPVLSIVTFTVAVTAWAVPLWAITLPIYAIAWPGAAPEIWSGERLDTPLKTLLAALGGLLILPLVPWVIRGTAAVDAALARPLLSPSKRDELEEQIGTLRETQARSVDIAMADRRQIERDLHDGAQQRLLALGMDLGMALEKFESDPEGARELLGGAHQEVQRAVQELRNLARGIHPAVLTDRGLDAALSSLAARSPVRVRLETDLDERPAASVEATAYFIVAEALTNAARYANASVVDVSVRQADGRLRLEIADDGIGGAEVRPGGGLAGLVDRASSVEGTLRVASPPGGPTVLTAELPCAS
jgi:signal transduction histidine kinase